MIKGDIIQITNKDHPWFPCLLIVDEPKDHGCVAYISMPQKNDRREITTAYNMLRHKDYEPVGAQVIIQGT